MWNKLSKWVLIGIGRGGIKTDKKYLENRLVGSMGEKADLSRFLVIIMFLSDGDFDI